MVATVRDNLSVTRGAINGVNMDIMLDSGSSVSLIRKDMANQMKKPTVLSPSVRPSLVTDYLLLTTYRGW